MGSYIDGVPTVPDIVQNVLYLFQFIPIVVISDECHFAHFIDEKIEA